MTEIDFGCDFHESFELLSPGGKFRTVSGIDNAKQVIQNTVTTIFNDLSLFDYSYSGNPSYKYLGATNIPYAKALIKLTTEESLSAQSMVQEVIDVEVNYKFKSCIVDTTIKLIDGTTLENLEIELYNNFEEEL